MIELENYKVGQVIHLDPVGSWPAAAHQIEDEALWAIRAALAAKRPLLLRGEPGCGKSQLARAAAKMLGRGFLSEVVHARQERRELQYHFDAVARLGEAQVLGAAKVTDVKEQLNPQRFVSPGVLWWAFDWKGANEQAQVCVSKVTVPQTPKDWNEDNGWVVLIDEIDKAETGLPNGLLETLGNNAFPVPYMDRPVGCVQGSVPLVVITTNEERELPAAFLRRCLVYNMGLPQDDDVLLEWLVKRGQAHFNDLEESVLLKAAELLRDDRQRAEHLGLPLPGQAEYIDMLRATHDMYSDETKQLEVLERIAGFALQKQKDDV